VASGLGLSSGLDLLTHSQPCLGVIDIYVSHPWWLMENLVKRGRRVSGERRKERRYSENRNTTSFEGSDYIRAQERHAPLLGKGSTCAVDKAKKGPLR